MSTFRKKATALGAILLITLSLASVTLVAAREEDAEKEVKPDSLKPAARAVLEEHTKGATDIKVAEESDDGFTMYEADYKVNGVLHSVVLTEAGAIVETEEGIAPSSLPAEVTSAFKKAHPSTEIDEAVQVTSHYFELQYKLKGKDKEDKLYANGKTVEMED